MGLTLFLSRSNSLLWNSGLVVCLPGPSFLSCVILGADPFLVPLSRVIKDQMRSKSWKGLGWGGGVLQQDRRTRLLEPPGLLGTFQGLQRTAGPDALCLDLFQAFLSPLDPCRHLN